MSAGRKNRKKGGSITCPDRGNWQPCHGVHAVFGGLFEAMLDSGCESNLTLVACFKEG